MARSKEEIEFEGKVHSCQRVPNRLYCLLRQILAGGLRVAKTLTSWSVLIGVLAALEVNAINSYNKVVSEQGILAALNSYQWRLLFPLTFVLVSLFALFVMAELKQSGKAEKAWSKLDKLDDVVIELKNITSLLTPPQQSQNKESGNCSHNQPEDESK